MYSFLTPEQVIERALKDKAKLEAQINYLQQQLGHLLLEEERRAPRRRRKGNLDFKVDIPKFEGQLDPNLFLDWLRRVEQVFEYEDVPEEKKVKLVALKLRKDASIWWENLVVKRARQGKPKIRTWEKMKSKLKVKFLPTHYLEDIYQMSPNTFPTSQNLPPPCPNPSTAQPTSQRDFPKPPPMGEPFYKVISFSPPKPMTTIPSTPQKSQAPQQVLTPQNRPVPGTLPPSKGLDHIALECPNEKIVTLTEYQALLEESEEKEEREEKALLLKKEQVEEVVEVANEGELSVLESALVSIEGSKEEQRELNSNPPRFDENEEENKVECEGTQEEEVIVEAKKGEEFLLEEEWSNHKEEDGQQENSNHMVKDEPYILIFDESNHAPIYSFTKTTFLAFIKPHIKEPFNLPSNRKGALKTKKDLFSWLILFQPLILFTHSILLHFVFFYHALIIRLGHKDKWKESSLRTNSHQPGEYDGDQATIEPKDEEGTKEAKKVTKEVKEVHAMVRNIINQDLDLLPGSPTFYPVFVWLITNDPAGVSAHSAHDTLA